MLYTIWMEGYRATGEHGTAQKLNEFPIEAESFDDAVKQLLVIEPEHATYYDKTGDRHSIWACQLYDNEQDARKHFG